MKKIMHRITAFITLFMLMFSTGMMAQTPATTRTSAGVTSAATTSAATRTVNAAVPAPKQTQLLDKILAVVNNAVITQSDLSERIKIVKMQLRHAKVKIPSNSVLRKQVLQQMIDQQLQLQAADKLNIVIDNDTLNKAITNIAKQNHMSLTQLRQSVLQQGIDYQDFRNEVRDELIISRAQTREVKPRVQVTDQEVDNFLSAFKQIEQKQLSYHVKDIVIDLPDTPSPDQIAKTRAKAQALVTQLRKGADFDTIAAQHSSGEQALNGGDLGWRNPARLPTVFAQQVVHMKKGDIAGPIRTSNGFHIIKLVDVKGHANTHVITQTKVRHILIKTNAVVSDAKAKAKIASIAQQIEHGASFADMAKRYSDDPGSASQGGELGWVTSDALVPGFAAAMNKLKVGQLSQPVKSQFGWHLIEVQARRKKDTTAQYERDHIRNLIGQRKYEEAIINWINELRAQAYIKKY